MFNLDSYINKKLIISQKHPRLPLTIYNYSDSCQYDKQWDEVTLACRGLVVAYDTIVARPFKKFFNLEEHNESDIPNLPFEVYEKMDGSLGILFNYNGEWVFASRGSFTSKQALKGFEMLNKINAYESLDSDYTYLFEIIYPENRIVCQYDFEDVVLLGAIRTYDGHEMPYDELPNVFKIVKRYDGINDYKALKNIIGNNQEGFVVKFSNGFRLKIKGEEYLRIHKIVTNLDNLYVWEHLKNNSDLDKMLENIPDEFYSAIKEITNDLLDSYSRIQNICNEAFANLDKTDRKTFALRVISNHKDYSSILFNMLDNKDYSANIWGMIKPTYSKLKL